MSWGYAPAFLEAFTQRTGRTDPDIYFGVDTRMVCAAPSQITHDYSAYLPERPPKGYFDEWGVYHIPTESADAAHTHLEGYLYPLQSASAPADILNYPFPDIDAESRYEWTHAHIRGLHTSGYATMGIAAQTFFETAWLMRGMDDLFADMIERPEMAEALLGKLLALRKKQCCLWAEAGVDILTLGDDVATQRSMMMSVPMWRKWFKPLMSEIIGAAKAIKPDLLVFYHSDGNCAAIIGDLIEIGVDILNPVQPECLNLAELKKLHGDHVSFWGTMGTQTTFPFGTPEDVRREVADRIALFGRDGGLLLGPSHMIEPEVPFENVEAFVQAVDAL